MKKRKNHLQKKLEEKKIYRKNLLYQIMILLQKQNQKLKLIIKLKKLYINQI